MLHPMRKNRFPSNRMHLRLAVWIQRCASVMIALKWSMAVHAQMIHTIHSDHDGGIRYMGQSINQRDSLNRRTGVWIDYSDASVRTDVTIGLVVDSTGSNHTDVVIARPSMQTVTLESLEWIRLGYYTAGRPEGIWTTYSRSGAIKLICVYQGGVLASGLYFTETGFLQASVELSDGSYRMRKISIDGSILKEMLISPGEVAIVFPG